MVEYTKNGKLIHEWKKYDPSLQEQKIQYSTMMRKDENDRFLQTFGSVNKSAFLRKLILQAIQEKENENN